MPDAEVILWSKLKGKQINNFKFRRQYSIGKFVLDFYCTEAKLAIEVDGDTHLYQKAEIYDQARQAAIKSLGIRFLRFTNDDVYKNLGGVLETIARALESGS